MNATAAGSTQRSWCRTASPEFPSRVKSQYFPLSCGVFGRFLGSASTFSTNPTWSDGVGVAPAHEKLTGIPR